MFETPTQRRRFFCVRIFLYRTKRAAKKPRFVRIPNRYCVLLFTIAPSIQAFLNQAVICLTEAVLAPIYSPFYVANICDLKGMSNKCKEAESPVVSLKNESARQRWELFHRAIAHAKQSNDQALSDADAVNGDATPSGPVLSIVR